MARCISGMHNIVLNLFHYMENEALLDPDNSVHLFCLHYVYLPRINASITAFVEAWNRHPMQSERGLSPWQLWISGMAEFYGQSGCFPMVSKLILNWASVSEPHTCDFNATFSLYIYIYIYIYVIYLSICDRHCTSKIAINISIFHLGSYTRRARIVPRRGAVGPTHFRSHCPRPPGAEL